jgi:hypothetical protein
MGTKIVFQYEIRDPSTFEWVRARRLATRDFINMVKGKELRLLEDTAREMDDSQLDSNGQTSLTQ